MASPELRRFLQILQSGDQQAIEAVLHELDPFLRKIIRLRLLDGRLRRVMDTTDIFQSLLKDFLSPKGEGQFARGSLGRVVCLPGRRRARVRQATIGGA